ncbi:MAG: hypothetical protein HIU81_04995 [Acidobacteria bacterium]|nr:hypothetical protein [Acidobacteriota bacterium]
MATQGIESRPHVVVAGSLNADLTIYTERLPAPGETVHGNGFAVHPGGKSANQAVAAARLGAPVKMLGAVGDDDNGQMLCKSLTRAGVDISSVGTSTEPTGVAIISVDTSAENSIIISAGANGTFSAADVERFAAAFSGAGAVCLCLEVSVDVVTAAARLGHEARATVLLNLSPFAQVPAVPWCWKGLRARRR